MVVLFMSFIQKKGIIDNKGLDNRYLYAILATLIMVLAIPALLVMLSNPVATNTTTISNSQTTSTSTTNKGLISDAVGEVVQSGYTSAVAVNPAMQLTVLVALQFSHPTQFNTYLTEVQNPSSPMYHHYMSATEFSATFAPSQGTYTKLVNYFTNHGLGVSTYNDRVSIKLVGSVAQFEQVFHTQIQMLTMNSKTFYAPTKKLSLNTDTSSISAIVGLNNYYKAQIATPVSEAVNAYQKYLNNPDYSNNPSFCNAYLGVYDYAQGGSCSNQLLVGSDMQTAYQVNQLFAHGNYAYNKTVATILWDGADPNSGKQVAPFNPADLVNYFANTLPAGQPQPNVCGTYNQAINQSYICGVPVDGAYPQPDITSKNDSSQANFESTLDLEMVGSVAPGANAIEVYGPAGWSNFLDDAFATILNAPASSPLSHTVAISNSWGIFDEPGPWGAIIDPLWIQYTQEAAARGITVLASTGDNANNAGEIPGAPSTVAYNNYGVVAVGGTTTMLTGTPSTDGSGTTGIANQTVWFGTPGASDGSQGGISVSYKEPVWQQQSFDANNIIKTAEPQISGRGTPDIAAIGANMNITISYFYYLKNGNVEFNHTNRMLPIWGTSVACPLAAGVVADMDNYLGTPEGFFNGLIYQLGQAQADGMYSSMQPFNDVTGGYNVIWFAYPGYDLATGWGSINAYNFVKDQMSVRTVTFKESGLPTGATWSVTLDNGATLTSSTNSISFMAENGTHTYMINNVMGHFSDITQGVVNMTGSNINVPIQFSNTIGSGQGVNNIVAQNIINNPAAVNFTFSALGSMSNLPMSEEFMTMNDSLVNHISLYLNGTGQVTASIGTNPWQSDVLSPITISVNGMGWYNVTFPAVMLKEAVTYYFLNVRIANTNYKNLNWGFNNDTAISQPNATVNDVGSYSPVSLEFPFNYYDLDTAHAALYSIGLVTTAPAIDGSTATITKPINSAVTLSWDVASTADNYGTQTYSIYKNGSTVAMGTWNSNNNITLTNQENLPGMYNYTLVVNDAFGGYAMSTVMVKITGSYPTATVTQTTSLTTTTTKSTPGFELLATVLGLAFVVTFYLRKKNKNT